MTEAMTHAMSTTRIAHDLSYATGMPGLRGQVVRAVEEVTGRSALVRRAHGYHADVARGGDFWEVMARRYGLRLELAGHALCDIPRDGPQWWSRTTRPESSTG